MQYLALLRGINVGGNALIPMATLRVALTEAGLQNVRTYIQSGNVLFESTEEDQDKLTVLVHDTIKNRFDLDVAVVIFSKPDWQAVIATAPAWWGKDTSWKHNIIVMLKPYDMLQTVLAIGELRPGIEKMQAGLGVLYQSLSWDNFSKTTGGKLAAKPVYKQMTVRNYNTATKLLTLLEAS